MISNHKIKSNVLDINKLHYENNFELLHIFNSYITKNNSIIEEIKEIIEGSFNIQYENNNIEYNNIKRKLEYDNNSNLKICKELYNDVNNIKLIDNLETNYCTKHKDIAYNSNNNILNNDNLLRKKTKLNEIYTNQNNSCLKKINYSFSKSSFLTPNFYTNKLYSEDNNNYCSNESYFTNDLDYNLADNIFDNKCTNILNSKYTIDNSNINKTNENKSLQTTASVSKISNNYIYKSNIKYNSEINMTSINTASDIYTNPRYSIINCLKFDNDTKIKEVCCSLLNSNKNCLNSILITDSPTNLSKLENIIYKTSNKHSCLLKNIALSNNILFKSIYLINILINSNTNRSNTSSKDDMQSLKIYEFNKDKDINSINNLIKNLNKTKKVDFNVIKEAKLYKNNNINSEIKVNQKITNTILKKTRIKRKLKDAEDGKYLMFDNITKKKAIIDAFLLGCKESSVINFVPVKSIKRWITVGPERKKGGGRKIKDPTMEKNLLNWYYNIRNSKHSYVTNNMIILKALEIRSSNSFIASKGWLEKFKEKYNIVTDKEKKKKHNKI